MAHRNHTYSHERVQPLALAVIKADEGNHSLTRTVRRELGEREETAGELETFLGGIGDSGRLASVTEVASAGSELPTFGTA